ncbi:odorant receptor 30a-like [Anopheles aquasalis]|uniref:odorant receptor 30a-like n=1 Tax=Anopheles aquasalis TaxID=42839 RepID=UPI00215A6489|nr:odorant receptor 30a-like [Anopheles aquasalis]
MATVESYQALCKYLIVASKIVGTEIWTAPGKMKPASYLLLFQVLIYFAANTYTVIKYRHDLIYVLKVLITLGSAVQLFIKFIVLLWRGNIFKKYGQQIERDLLRPFENGTEEEMAALSRAGRFLWGFYHFLGYLILSTGIGFVLYPFFVYITQGTLLPLFLYELPYLDWHSVDKYFFHFAFQLELYAVGMVGELMSDFLIVMNSIYALARADLCIVHLCELRVMLDAASKKPDAADIAAVRRKWEQCMHDHRIATSFLNNVEDLFGMICLAQVMMGVFTVCNCMLLVVLTDWYPVYVFLGATFLELSAFFVIGHLVEKKVDELYDAITSLSWYQLSLQQQKEYAFVVYRQQRPLGLTAFGFMPLNFESYMSVLKGLYQFFVLVLQYVE